MTTAGLSKRVQEWYQLQIEVRAVGAPGGDRGDETCAGSANRY